METLKSRHLGLPAIACAMLGLSGCVSVVTTPLPNNQAISHYYPESVSQKGGYLGNLSFAYSSGNFGVQKNVPEAVRVNLRAAETGASWAMGSLGDHYWNVEKDPTTAAYWYFKAVKAGRTSALDNLARIAEENTADPNGRVEALALASLSGNTIMAKRLSASMKPEDIVAASQRALALQALLGGKVKP